ncbi:hypothetical protein Sm713_59190 [Streptomyces sp. TS71-3]|nr:hypothetical protein Sm713_59190 [Streptomyces sp. TS71-3]
MFGREQRDLTPQRLTQIGPDQRLFPPPGVHEQHALGARKSAVCAMCAVSSVCATTVGGSIALAGARACPGPPARRGLSLRSGPATRSRYVTRGGRFTRGGPATRGRGFTQGRHSARSGLSTRGAPAGGTRAFAPTGPTDATGPTGPISPVGVCTATGILTATGLRIVTGVLTALGECRQQLAYRLFAEEREVSGEHDDAVGRGAAQAGVECREGAAATGLFQGPLHRPQRGPASADDHGGGRTGAGGQDTVEQRPAAHAHSRFVRPSEPPGRAARQNDGVEDGPGRPGIRTPGLGHGRPGSATPVGCGARLTRGLGRIRGHPPSMSARAIFATPTQTPNRSKPASHPVTGCAATPQAAPRTR